MIKTKIKTCISKMRKGSASWAQNRIFHEIRIENKWKIRCLPVFEMLTPGKSGLSSDERRYGTWF